MLKAGDIAIVNGARTPCGRYGGKLKDFTAQELGAVAAKDFYGFAMLRLSGLPASVKVKVR